ncbi:phosphoenolpyruvate--protein phosphotransferase [Phaeovibrio sulfidiphilus]|uniref:Phosphoenolpyruvate-protein phosphotransferase n=1 Tax=Phaeovibrio sulfidiphilus TaxID=1220600 RepID=A0A8J6YL19_9PROT|nr:phosphoenolpyruvate--protein phosphotransferase [Phaeovibrio sulfidiphilus]MBE1236463.1 phosphoenolpyruvate--protein phosphotransferase [Phaeovibrio sulfidiphilus]
MKRTRPPAPPPQAEPVRSLHIKGLGVGPGIGIGEITLYAPDALHIPEHTILPEDVDAEQQRVLQAAEKSALQLGALRDSARAMPGPVGEELDVLLEAYQQMLGSSRLIMDVLARIESERVNAEAAVRHEMEAIAHTFAAMDDPYLAARADDMRDVGGRLIRALVGSVEQSLSNLDPRSVLVADTLSPADTALLHPGSVAGLVLERGGTESHTAIMARSLGLPCIVGATGLMEVARHGDIICFDGETGLVILNPDDETLAEYRRREEAHRTRQKMLASLRDLPAVTPDGIRITLMANVELGSELDSVFEAGAEGVGLFRTEFLYMNRTTLPDEEEQYTELRSLVVAMKGKPVIIRTLDVGGDKLSGALGLEIPANPALGLRAIRLCLQRPEILETQFAAILRAAVLGPVRILIPMIASKDELLAVREIFNRVVTRLHTQGLTLPNPLPPIGVMIEVPAAALFADDLARHCDFFSIGTNDLIQYTLAIDRADETVAHLYDPLHPAVLRLIQYTIKAAAEAEIPIAVCGEMAGDPRLAALLVGMGVRTLSMAPSRIPRVKHNLRQLDMGLAVSRAQQILKSTDSSTIRDLAESLMVDETV